MNWTIIFGSRDFDTIYSLIYKVVDWDYSVFLHKRCILLEYPDKIGFPYFISEIKYISQKEVDAIFLNQSRHGNHSQITLPNEVMEPIPKYCVFGKHAIYVPNKI